MPNPESSAFQIVVSFLGGGLVAAIGNWVHNTRSVRRQREIDRLSAQLAEFYGPLFFLTSQNDRLFELAAAIDVQYGLHFVEREWDTSNPVAKAEVDKSAKSTLALANAYIQRVVENNAQAMRLLESKWHMADAEDLPLFSHFQLDFTRFKTEVESGNFREVPFLITRALGAISYMRPELITRVQYRVEKKRAEIRELSIPWYSRADF